MDDEEQSPEDMHRAINGVVGPTNIGFLSRYWSTARAALERVVDSPDGFAEFQGESNPKYISAVVSNHLDNHNYSGVLLTYANLDEFMVVITKMLGDTCRSRITATDLKDRGVRRYKKFVCQVCGIAESTLGIDWAFLEDFSAVRNALIHANGNLTLMSNRREIEGVVRRHPDLLGYRHSTTLTVSADFVERCMVATRTTALTLLSADRQRAQSDRPRKNAGST
jgi:hypothetical protein